MRQQHKSGIHQKWTPDECVRMRRGVGREWVAAADDQRRGLTVAAAQCVGTIRADDVAIVAEAQHIVSGG